MPLEQIRNNLEAETENVLQHFEGKGIDPWNRIEELDEQIADLLDDIANLQDEIGELHELLDDREALLDHFNINY